METCIKFKCWYCTCGFETFEKVIEHGKSEHPDDKLKFRSLALNPTTGRSGYVSKEFDFVPKEVDAKGCNIIVCDDQKVRIVQCTVPDTSPSCSYDVKKEEDDNLSKDVKLLQSLAPAVSKCLKSCGQLSSWIRLNEMLAEGSFPVDNISFQLFMDVVAFLGTETTVQMRYSEQVKMFWATGYRLFHGRFLRFMGGPKSIGQLVGGLAEKGKYDPRDANINFAVPGTKCLRSSTPLKQSVLRPGILEDTLKALGGTNKQIKICFDGKRINPCLTEKQGDVDLFGCEEHPTLEELVQRKEDELSSISQMIDRADDYIAEYDMTPVIVSDMQEAAKIVSLRIKQLREISAFKEEGVKKFKNLGQPDWRKSKYVFVISSLQSSLYEIAEAVKSCLDTTDRLLKLCARVQGTGHLYRSGAATVDLSQQDNYVCIRSHDNANTSSVVSDGHDRQRFIMKQRSDTWHEVRKKARVTGSTAHRALGLQTLKEQISHFDEVFHHQSRKEVSSQTQKCFDHGMKNEIHATTTLVAKVLPAYFPDLKYVEEGCISMGQGADRNFFVVSPDGSGRAAPDATATLAFEFKCPYKEKTFVPQVHYAIPKYYVVQLLSEMAALQCSHLLFLSYTLQSTTVFQVHFSEDLWKKVLNELCILYGGETPKRPNKVTEKVKELKEDLERFSVENVKFLCEIPSAQGQACAHGADTESSSLYGFHTSSNQQTDVECWSYEQTLYKAQMCIKESFNLTRRRATELFIFMASDLDRFSSSERPHSVPIAYGLQGPSITTDTAKKMLCKVLNAADEEDLDPIVFACDGQWIKVINRDFDGKPLTQLQKQKTHWDEVRKLPKERLLKLFADLTVTGPCEGEERNTTVSLQSVALKRRHRRLLTPSKQKVSQQANVPSDSDLIASAINLLPGNLEDKVDASTYSEIVDAVKALIADSDQQADTEAGTEQDADRSTDEADCNLQLVVLEQKHFEIMISAFSSDSKEQVPQKWKEKTTNDLKELLSSVESMMTQLTKQEVKICLKTLKQMFPKETKHVLLSLPKWKMVNCLAGLLGLETRTTGSRRQRKSCPSLRDLSLKQSKKLPKQLLCAMYAEITYPGKEREWRDTFPFATCSLLDGEDSVTWFSYPLMRERPPRPVLPLLGFVDAHHILTNLRCKVCSSGLPSRGIYREAWLKVAKDSRENKSGLSLAHVEDLIDRQSNAFAQATFSEKVESAMRDNGDANEADFCQLVRRWYQAEDEPGMSSSARLCYRLEFRNWILQEYRPLEFPPPASYVGGIPVVTFEAILTNIERKLQAYAFVESYNPRALSTLDAENFFSIVGDYAPCGSRLAIRPDDIPTAMKTACELSLLQMDPKRPFHMHISRAPVYQRIDLLQKECPDDASDSVLHSACPFSDLSVIDTSDHAFDHPMRRGKGGKRKSSDVSRPDRPSKGARGVRQFYRTDESKILPHVRLGIELE